MEFNVQTVILWQPDTPTLIQRQAIYDAWDSLVAQGLAGGTPIIEPGPSGTRVIRHWATVEAAANWVTYCNDYPGIISADIIP